jgi:IPT/TIG domain
MLARALPLVVGLGLFVGCGETDRKLKVTGLEPTKGDVEGGTYIVIKGNRFIADGPRNAKVYFGSRQGTVVRFQSDKELIVQAPGGKAEEMVDVLVIFDPGGQLKIPNAFKFIDKADAGMNADDIGKKK